MIAAAVAKYLTAQVTGLSYSTTTTSGNVYIAYMPATPDTAVMVMPTGGAREASLDPHTSPTLQILVRGERHDRTDAYEMAETILGKLAGLDLVTLDDGGTDEVFVIGTTAAQSAPIPMGIDSNDRPEWSLNIELQVYAPTTHRPAYS